MCRSFGGFLLSSGEEERDGLLGCKQMCILLIPKAKKNLKS